MNPTADSITPVDAFIDRWKASSASERANYALFLTELCDLLSVPRPEPTRADVAENAYVIERDVTFVQGDGTTTTGRIDLYKRGCFVLEAKQGSEQAREAELAARALAAPTDKRARSKKGTAVRGTPAWDDAMVRARGQAEAYAKALPSSEGWPPFLIVVDVGHVIELYSEFTRSGKAYVMFPDPQSFRIKLEDLRDETIRQRLAAVWTDPLSLDPSRRSAKVTRELAERLATLAKLLEKAGHDPALVARFLMRCLFTMFAEDVKLIPHESFQNLLESLRDDPASFQPMIEALWQTMNAGGFSTILRKHLLRFNGGLFAEHQALPLDKPMLALLIEAAKSNWSDVEPAIFGTLLERALDERERHKLGAHYTPRAYVERLVMPTVIDPLRDEWKTIYAAALTHARAGEMKEAQDEVLAFHERLSATRVLDPACGTGNFLYVTLELMKRLEGEVLNALREFGYEQQLLDIHGVDPHQFLGLEINPRAAAIADLVLWIGYLQWHFRTRGKTTPAEPIIKNYQNIECRDAVLAWDAVEEVRDEHGRPVTRWDGRTMKTHPVTGEQVPDDAACVPLLNYLNPRNADWPRADYIVGNPPFVGNKRMREMLGDGYVSALRAAHSELAESVDYVMFWWQHAARLLAHQSLRRFGLITTNSITQTFNSRVIAEHLNGTPPISLDLAIPDHPWVDDASGADVRIAMSVASSGSHDGTLLRLANEFPDGGEIRDTDLLPTRGRISPALEIGFDSHHLARLDSNRGLACPGVQLSGQGFVLSADESQSFSRETIARLVRPYLTGRDLVQTTRVQFVVDTFGLTESELRSRYPDAYQWLYDRVRPERLQNPRDKYRREWWLHSEPRAKFRTALAGLTTLIVTSRTARHRTFQFLSAANLFETKVLVFGLGDPYSIGILSSRTHVLFANRTGGWLGVGNDSTYNHSICFETFPFPAATETQKQRIRELGEQLDSHRKRQQAAHPGLTMTGIYNVLEKLRADEALNAKEQVIHEQGLVSVLKQLHDDLDAAVFAAYGWPTTLTDEEILERLVALNAERAAEEARGLVRWLRPEFQNPTGSAAQQQPLALADDEETESAETTLAMNSTSATPAKRPWPKDRADRTRAVQDALAAVAEPVTPEELARQFMRARSDQVGDILDALHSLGLARRSRGKYSR